MIVFRLKHTIIYKTTRNFECILWLKRLKVVKTFNHVMTKRNMSERA